MYFHTDDLRTVNLIAAVADTAAAGAQSLRIDVDAEGNLRIKRGQGMWSAPLPSTPDPYRDKPDTDDGQVCPDCQAGNGTHFLNCPVWGFNK